MYFSFTTLSTVGFGDLKPLNSAEYLVGSLIMFFGVALFSFITSKFLCIIEIFKEFGKDLGEEEKLDQFFNCMQYFNKDHKFDTGLRNQIEEFFKHRWKNDKNQCLYREEEELFFNQLPDMI